MFICIMVPESSVPRPIKLRWTEYLKFSNKLENWLMIRLYLLWKNIFLEGAFNGHKKGWRLNTILKWRQVPFFLSTVDSFKRGSLQIHQIFKENYFKKKNLVLHKNLKVFPISIEHKDSPKKDQTFFQHCSRPQELGKL